MIADALSAVDTPLHSCVGVVCLSHAESRHKNIRKPAVGIKNGNAPFLIYSGLACSVTDGGRSVYEMRFRVWLKGEETYKTINDTVL